MKTASILAALLILGILPAAPGAPQPPADGSELTRFDLDFSGGTPAQFVGAVSKALGRNLNVVIPDEAADTKIMPIKMTGITVPDLFTAVSMASDHEVLFPPLPRSAGPQPPQYRRIFINFKHASGGGQGPITNDSTWAFSTTALSPEDLARLDPPPAPAVCRYFQLAPYLKNYTIEDITTAIQTGWKMLGMEPPPKLSFHRETKLLVAVGPGASIEMIPQVLSQLPKDSGPEAGKNVGDTPREPPVERRIIRPKPIGAP